ncbi:MAG: hypothetical protein JWO06_1642, partial [Bacteroidota bacterium]|nr:hypothetical protein [Bacteroidota bacterium]
DVIIDTQSFAGILAKVDSSGSPIWYRRYRVSTAISPDYAWNYLYDVDLMQNGDIVAVGSWVSTTSNGPLYVPQVGWILRVNSNGCMDNGDCGISGIDDKPSPTSSMQFRPVQIFPNPSNGIFNVNAMAQLPAATCIDVYDALGKKLLSQPIFFHSNLINLYHLANGVYFYKITNGLFTVEEGELVIQK